MFYYYLIVFWQCGQTRVGEPMGVRATARAELATLTGYHDGRLSTLQHHRGNGDVHSPRPPAGEPPPRDRPPPWGPPSRSRSKRAASSLDHTRATHSAEHTTRALSEVAGLPSGVQPPGSGPEPHRWLAPGNPRGGLELPAVRRRVRYAGQIMRKSRRPYRRGDG